MSTKIRRINLYAGPGAGKSTMSAWAFYYIKSNYPKINIELVQEFVKEMAWLNQKPSGFDQFFISASQMHREEKLLRNGVDLIVTDSPVSLFKFYSSDFLNHGLSTIISEYENQYPGVNIFINRNDKPYNDSGRFHNKEQAVELDSIIKGQINYHYEVDFNDTERLAEIIQEIMK